MLTTESVNCRDVIEKSVNIDIDNTPQVLKMCLALSKTFDKTAKCSTLK